MTRIANYPSVPRAYWVEPGRLLAGAHPATRSCAETMERIDLLLAAGVTAFIDLTEPDEHVPYVTLLPTHAGPHKRELLYCRKPLRDHEVPQTPDIMLDILECLVRTLADGHCVYLHCRAGIGRTGMVLGCYLVHCGMDSEQALARLQQLWEEGGRSATWPHTPETDEQFDYIRHWGRPRTSWWPLWKRS